MSKRIHGAAIIDQDRPRSRAALEADLPVLSPSLARSNDSLYIERGEGCYLIDLDGNRYLDFSAGIAVSATGYGHPAIRKAAEEQIGRFIHLPGSTTGFESFTKLNQALAGILPSGPGRVFLANSGTEAIEAAFKLVRWHTGRKQVVAFLSSFHGRTMGALSLTASKLVQKRRYFPLIPGVTHIPYANCLRCPVGREVSSCEVQCLMQLEDDLFAHNLPPEEVGAIFVEPVQGEGGYVIPPTKFFKALMRLREKYGMLLVADEIQTGMGRTGRLLASEHFGFEPDIVAIGKGLGSGFPIGAIIAKESLMDWDKGSHASTFGGNAVACAAGVATLDLLKNGLMDQAQVMGERLVNGLREKFGSWDRVGDIRGLGLMVAMEMVTDRQSMRPDPALRDALIKAAQRRGLILMGCGTSALRFTPPLVISAGEIDEGLELLAQARSDC